jgi:levanase/fructan beta-fructosidase
MKKLFLTLMAIMTLTLAQAQVTPLVLGEKHTMLRLEQGKKYILMPV